MHMRMNYPYKYSGAGPYMYGMPNTDIAGNPCFTHMSMSALILMWPDPISCRGVISFSISAPLKKGSGRVYRVHLLFTLTKNVLVICLSLTAHALKRWFFMLRDEMEFDKVVRDG